jgi:hypothetical protein
VIIFRLLSLLDSIVLVLQLVLVLGACANLWEILDSSWDSTGYHFGFSWVLLEIASVRVCCGPDVLQR